MQILPPGSFQVAALARPAYASGSPLPQSFGLDVEVTVQDRLLREQFAGFNGCERLTLHVPNRDGSWQQIPMHWDGTRSVRTTVVDAHAAHVNNIDLNTVMTQGVAITLETNAGY